jgi:hypothetical protein
MIPVGILCGDSIAPTGAFTSPAAGNVSGTIAISVNASDNDSIASVQFQIDGVNIGAPDTAAPFTVNYDTRTLLNGAHTFSAIIRDRSGNTLVITRGVTFANAPVVTITSPANGANINGTIGVSATVTHYDATCSTQFKIDGTNYGLAQNGSGSLTVPNLDTHTLALGAHTFSATATDGHGNVTTVNSNVSCNNVKPASGFLLFDEWLKYNEDADTYDGGRQTSFSFDLRWDWKYKWSADQSVQGYNLRYLPGNPDGTHYQMSCQYGTNSNGRTEGGSDGNTEYIGVVIQGVSEVNNPITIDWGPYREGPVTDVAGGNGIQMNAWCTNPGINTNFRQGIGMYYDFRPKAGYLS